MSLENKYDDPVFFEKYSQMDRSREGLSGAGEWQTLRSILPEFAGSGCWTWAAATDGTAFTLRSRGPALCLGWTCRRKCWRRPGGKPASPRWSTAAAPWRRRSSPAAALRWCSAPLALHYVKDYPALVRKVREWLAPGGDFVFTCEHPVFTAQGPQDWEYDREGNIRHFPVDRYFVEGERDACFLGEHVVKYHRTLTTLLETLLENGFALLHVKEPQPPAEMLSRPGWADELRRPMMLAVAGPAAVRGGRRR